VGYEINQIAVDPLHSDCHLVRKGGFESRSTASKRYLVFYLKCLDFSPNQTNFTRKCWRNFRLRRKKTPKTPLPAPYITRAKTAGKKKNISPVFSQKKTVFLRKSGVFSCLVRVRAP
jgi:hypothetical protein